MKYGAAFAKLGYRLENPRQDWSAEKADGVCITLWRAEIDWDSMCMDSRLHGGPLEEWVNLPGNRKRVRHALRAVAEFDRVVDVIVVDGTPGHGVTSAHPWMPSQRNGLLWRITELEEETGHIRLEAKA